MALALVSELSTCFWSGPPRLIQLTLCGQARPPSMSDAHPSSRVPIIKFGTRRGVNYKACEVPRARDWGADNKNRETVGRRDGAPPPSTRLPTLQEKTRVLDGLIRKPPLKVLA